MYMAMTFRVLLHSALEYHDDIHNAKGDSSAGAAKGCQGNQAQHAESSGEVTTYNTSAAILPTIKSAGCDMHMRDMLPK